MNGSIGSAAELERGPLGSHTPCRAAGDVQVMLALLMGLQAGLPPLDFSPLERRGRAAYIAGIHAAVGHNYQPLATMFGRVIARTWKRHAASSAR